MARGSYVLAMFTVGDERPGYERLTNALLELDSLMLRTGARGTKLAEAGEMKQPEDSGIPQPVTDGTKRIETDTAWETVHTCLRHRKSIALSECWDRPVEWIALKDAVGRYAGEFVNIYPPGTPILVPGERLEETDRQLIERYLEAGLKVQGITGQDGEPGLAVLTEPMK